MDLARQQTQGRSNDQPEDEKRNEKIRHEVLVVRLSVQSRIVERRTLRDILKEASGLTSGSGEGTRGSRLQ